jgi:hypothetical protein
MTRSLPPTTSPPLTNWQYFYPAFQLLLAMGPLAVLVMLGPSDSAAMILGGIVSLALCWKDITVRDIKSVMPVVVGIGTYAVLAIVNRAHVDSYFGHYAILSVFYALPAGWVVRGIIRNGRSESVALAFAIFSLFLCVAAVKAIQASGVEGIVNVTTSDVSRTNRIGDQAFYWRFFYISNVIVGIIPYTFFALCGAIILFIRVRLMTKFFLIAAFALGVYVNFLVVTRTALAAAAITFILLFLGVLRSRTKLNVAAVAVGAICVIAVAGYLAIMLRFESLSLIDRFLRTGEDGRWVIWKESIQLLAEYPMGGGVVRLRSAYWGHNLFLDIGLTTGLLGMLAVTTAIGSIVWRLFNMARRKQLLTDPGSIYMVCFFVGGFIVSSLMPPQLPVIVVLLMSGTALMRDMPQRGAANIETARFRPGRKSAHLPSRTA